MPLATHLQGVINDKVGRDRVLRELCRTPFYAAKYVELFLRHGDLFENAANVNRTVLMLSLLLQGLNHQCVLSRDVFTNLEVCCIIRAKINADLPRASFFRIPYFWSATFITWIPYFWSPTFLRQKKAYKKSARY